MGVKIVMSHCVNSMEIALFVNVKSSAEIQGIIGTRLNMRDKVLWGENQ